MPRLTALASRLLTILNFQGQLGPTYAITAAASSVNEGASLTFTVTTTGVANGTVLYWTLSNTTDFQASSGSITINSGSATFSVTATQDTVTENETFTASIRTGSITGDIVATSGTITINDTLPSTVWSLQAVNQDWAPRWPSYNIGTQLGSSYSTLCSGFSVHPDGTSIFVVDSGLGRLYRWNLPYAWTFKAAVKATGWENSNLNYNVLNCTHSQPNCVISAEGLFIRPTGSQYFVLDDSTGRIHTNNFGLLGAGGIYDPWYVNVGENARVFNLTDYSPVETQYRDVSFSADGLRMYAIGTILELLLSFTLTSPYNTDTATWDGDAYWPYKDFSQNSGFSSNRGIQFKPDGSKFIVVDNTNDRFYEFACATPFNLGKCIRGNYYFFGGTEATGYDIYVNPEGSRIYLVGQTQTTVDGLARVYVRQFNMSGWAVNTISFAYSFLVSREYNQELNPGGITFKPDGTKMFLTWSTRDLVVSYTLSTPWELSTAVWDGLETYPRTYVSASGAGAGTTRGIFFRPDGTRMYAVGSTDDYVAQWDLSSAWNVASATYSGRYNVGGQDTVPEDIYWRSDGATWYMVGSTNDQVRQYNCGTAWDVTTSSLANSFSVATQETTPGGIFFSSDGTKMYIMGSTGDDINEYNLSSAWDISTAVYSQLKSVSAQSTVPAGLFFTNDGLNCYVAGGAQIIYQYSLSSAWNISTLAYVRSYTTPNETVTRGVFFRDNGLRMYTVGGSGYAYQYDLSSAWNIGTASQVSLTSGIGYRDISAQTSIHYCMTLNPTGTMMYIGGNSTQIWYWSMSTPYDLSTLSYVGSTVLGGSANTIYGIDFNSDGTVFYASHLVDLYRYNLATPYALNTNSVASETLGIGYLDLTSYDSTPVSVRFNDTGTIMYYLGSASDNIHQFTLSTPWAIHTASYTNKTFNVSAQASTSQGMHFKPDGTQLWIAESTTDHVHRYELATPWEINTASYPPITGPGYYKDATYAGSGYKIKFKPDGFEMYILTESTDVLHQYSLATAWEIHTATYQRSFNVNVASTVITPNGFCFNNDGTKLFVADSSYDNIGTYTLSTAWNIGTASFQSAFNVTAQDGIATGIAFNDTGTLFFMLGRSNNRIYVYNVSTAFDLSTAVYSYFWNPASGTGYFQNGTFGTTTPEDIQWRPNGDRLFVLENLSNGSVWEYAPTSGAYNLTSIVWYYRKYQVSDPTMEESLQTGFAVSPDGTRMYVIGTDQDAVFSYTLYNT